MKKISGMISRKQMTELMITGRLAATSGYWISVADLDSWIGGSTIVGLDVMDNVVAAIPTKPYETSNVRIVDRFGKYTDGTILTIYSHKDDADWNLGEDNCN